MYDHSPTGTSIVRVTVNVKAQSLAARSENISTASLLLFADLLAIIEMDIVAHTDHHRQESTRSLQRLGHVPNLSAATIHQFRQLLEL